MLLGGLWHGASWKFVFWGMLHGSALAVERFFKQYIHLPKNIFVRAIQVFLTFHFVIFAWLFFRAKDFSTVMDMLHNIGSIRFDIVQFTSIIFAYKNVMLLMLFGFLWHFIPKKWEQKLLQVFSALPIVAKALLFGLLFWAIYVTASAETQAFIYFQF
jgi:D-alanyl-lipoteichoic acid acyltransferase DltB (MBOAT superfamily)